MPKRIKTAVFVLLAVTISIITSFMASGCKYSKLYGTYYFDAGVCSVSQNAYEDVHIKKQEDGTYSNVNGLFNTEDFWIKIEKDKVTVHGRFSPVVAGFNVTFNVTTERDIEYTDISFELREDGNYYKIMSSGEYTDIQVGVNGSIAVIAYESGDGFSYQLSYTYN